MSAPHRRVRGNRSGSENQGPSREAKLSSHQYAASCHVLSVVSFCRQFILVPSLEFGHVASLPGLVGVSWVGKSELHGVGAKRGTELRSMTTGTNPPDHRGGDALCTRGLGEFGEMPLPCGAAIQIPGSVVFTFMVLSL